MKKISILVIFILTVYLSYAQTHEEGLPYVKNYTSKEYNAYTQNYGLTQDNRGVLYFANFSGVLEFDGENWNLISTDNGYRVTAIKSDKNGNVFVGGLGIFGMLVPNSKNGTLEFKNLLSAEYSSESDFSAIEDMYFDISKVGEKNLLETKNIFVDDSNVVFFVTRKGIISFKDNKISLFYKTFTEILSASFFNNQIYIAENENGIKKISASTIKQIVLDKKVEDLFSIDFLVEINKDSCLLGVGKSGLYILKNDTIYNIDFECESYFLENDITSGILLPNKKIAIGTLRGGVVIINTQGEIIQKIDIEAGLNSESVSFLYFSKEQNIWATLYNGISQIQYPSALTYFNETNDLNGEILDIAKFNNNIYAATKIGLFKLTGNKFSRITQIIYPCNALEVADNELFIATANGLFSLKNDFIEKISEEFIISLFFDNFDGKTLYVAMLEGVSVFKNNGVWTKSSQLQDIDFEIWNIVKDNSSNIWFQSSTNGVIKLSLETNETKLYGIEDGLPSLYSNQLNIVDNEVFIGTENGIYKYNKETDFFEKSNVFVSDITFSQFLTVIYGKTNLDRFFFESNWVSDIKIDKSGNIWTNKGDKKSITIYLKSGDYYIKHQTPFLPLADFAAKNIFCDTTSGFVWFGGDEGLVRYNPDIQTKFDVQFNTLIRKVKLKNDSVIFDGTFFDENFIPQCIQNSDFIKVIDFDYNTVNFSFSASTYNINDEIKYQYFLEGFDQNWSEWTLETSKEYTNLPEGNYTFFVKSQNIYGVAGKTAQFQFEILTPLYRTWWAIAIYIILISSVIYLLIRWRLRILRIEKENLENIVKERTEEIENQKEELQAQSEELAHKNQELERIDQIVQAINSEIHFESLLKSFLQRLISMTSMDRATALIYDKKANAYKFKATIGIDIKILENLDISFEDASQRYMKNAVEVSDGIFYQNIVKQIGFSLPSDEAGRPKSLLSIIVQLNDKIEGFLIISSTKYFDAFTESDFSLAKNLKEHINSAFIKAQILENLQDTLTNLKETQDELIRKEKLASVGQLTKGIVDRLINPMNYINNFSDISKDLSKEISEIVKEDKNLSKNTLDEVEDVLSMLNSNLEKIRSHGMSATRIVKGMEKLLKEKSTQFKDINAEELINNAINRAIAEYKAENADFDVEIIKKIDADFEQIHGLSNELTDVLIYLLNNSCYAVHQKKLLDKNQNLKIEITAQKNAENSIIKVKDNGVGIVEKELSHIFEPFFTTKPTSKGTGLGLFMAQDIIKMHKGEISVNSIHNEFTEVTIIIPN